MYDCSVLWSKFVRAQKQKITHIHTHWERETKKSLWHRLYLIAWFISAFFHMLLCCFKNQNTNHAKSAPSSCTNILYGLWPRIIRFVNHTTFRFQEDEFRRKIKRWNEWHIFCTNARRNTKMWVWKVQLQFRWRFESWVKVFLFVYHWKWPMKNRHAAFVLFRSKFK